MTSRAGAVVVWWYVALVGAAILYFYPGPGLARVYQPTHLRDILPLTVIFVAVAGVAVLVPCVLVSVLMLRFLTRRVSGLLAGAVAAVSGPLVVGALLPSYDAPFYRNAAVLIPVAVVCAKLWQTLRA